MHFYTIVFCIVALFAVSSPSYALLSGFEIEVGWALCKVVFALQGTIGKALASLAVIILGVSAFFGKISWGFAVTVAAGILILFGAMEIVSMFSGGILDMLLNTLPGNAVETRCFAMGVCSTLSSLSGISSLPSCTEIGEALSNLVP